jgi:hypothetical protein
MMTVKAGKFWVSEITFTDGLASKKRISCNYCYDLENYY